MSEARSEAFASTVETLRCRLPERDELLLCLDFDGTLSPVVDDPDAAEILPEARAAVVELHSHPDVTVAVVSGRRLDDVRTRVGVPGVTYAGNHGLELRTEGVTKVHPVAKTYRRDVEQTCSKLREAFDGEAGVDVENKGQTLTVHHRHAPDRRATAVRETVARVIGEHASGTLTVRGDSEAVEVRPAVDWGKGSVVTALLRERTDCLPVFVGNGRTDEAGFRRVERDGVGVRVGDPEERATAATEFVRGPREAAALLEWLSRTGVDELGGPVEPGGRPSTTAPADDRRTPSR